jgi:hypothetical protein
MSELLSPVYLFAFGFYLALLMLLLSIVFAVLRKWKSLRFSCVGLCLAVGLVVAVVGFGDWRVAACYDGSGNRLSELPQCRYPF